MMRRVKWGRVVRWGVLIGAPFAAGFLLALLLERDWLPNPLVTGTYRVDLAGLIVRLGALLSLLLLSLLLMRARSDRRMERARRQVDARQTGARRDFLRRLDHELKNPLTIIHLGIVNLRESPNLTPAQSQSLERIAQQTARLQKLVVDLRWLADLAEGRMEHAPVDLRDVLEEAIDLAQNGAARPARSVTLRVQETPWPVSPVAGDRELLVAAFRNLLDNALKYTANDDRIEVRASEDGRSAIVEVADTGAGIDAAEQDLIFENLYRSQGARGIPGSGLGLPLVQQIIALHGGHIRVRSRPQTGTVFTVQLPLASTSK